jgi:Mg-chelatase subunit ChlD
MAAATETPTETRPATPGRSDAIELVVDTSGSMRKRLGSRTRIELAREVLTQLVRDDLPADARVALRRFPPRSDPCGSDLLVPLSTLDPESMQATIDRLDAPSEARTPLAAAIAAAALDLADVEGRRLIVVVSDGKESCKGDPLAEVERLRAEGIDVTLNIVGLALDRASRRGIARLAETGGGAYFDARDGEALGEALRAALGASVEVRDAEGAVVGRSTVGGQPIGLPSGTYDLVVLDEPPVTFAGVYVAPGADVVLTLPAPGG